MTMTTQRRLTILIVLIVIGLAAAAVLVRAQVTPSLPPEGVKGVLVSDSGREVQSVRLVNDQDPWYQRNSVFILGTIFTVVGWAIRMKLDSIASQIRAEFKVETTAVRESLAAERAEREKSMITVASNFKESMSRFEGTVVGLDKSVLALGPAILTMSQASNSVAVCQARIEQLELQVRELTLTSRGYKEAHGGS